MRLVPAISLLGSAFLMAGCALFQKSGRPVDVNENMPAVTDVVKAVQAAIDQTAANSAWQESDAYEKAKQKCAAQKQSEADAYAQACQPLLFSARQACRKESGPTAEILCEDYLREAVESCGTPPGAPSVCADAATLRPPRIKLAKLDFAAASASNVGGGASLKLINAKASAKAGLTSTYSIELVPMPRIEPYLSAKTRGDAIAPEVPAVTRSLQAALTAALNAAIVKKCDPTAEGSPSPISCTWAKAPQLTLKSASYKFEISYEQVRNLDFKWTISSLKLADGTFDAGQERKSGNVLTVEIER